MAKILVVAFLFFKAANRWNLFVSLADLLVGSLSNSAYPALRNVGAALGRGFLMVFLVVPLKRVDSERSGLPVWMSTLKLCHS